MTAVRKRRPRIYAAHPMTTYGMGIEAFAIARIAELLPGVDVINPATRYMDSEHWQTYWPLLVPTLSGLSCSETRTGPSGQGASGSWRTPGVGTSRWRCSTWKAELAGSGS